MAIPTNPILISQVIETAVSLNDADWLIVDQGGTHKKVAGSLFGAVSLWEKNLDDTIYYIAGRVGVGNFTDPRQPFHIEASDPTGMLLESDTVNGNTVVITDDGNGIGRQPGLSYTAGLNGYARWADFMDSDNDEYHMAFRHDTQVTQFLFTAAGAFITPFMRTGPNLPGDIWNNAGTLNIS